MRLDVETVFSAWLTASMRAKGATFIHPPTPRSYCPAGATSAP